MKECFEIYTEDEKKELKKIMESEQAKKTPFTQSMGASLMNAIGEQGNLLKEILTSLRRIEATLSEQQNR